MQNNSLDQLICILHYYEISYVFDTCIYNVFVFSTINKPILRLRCTGVPYLMHEIQIQVVHARTLTALLAGSNRGQTPGVRNTPPSSNLYNVFVVLVVHEAFVIDKKNIVHKKNVKRIEQVKCYQLCFHTVLITTLLPLKITNYDL
ncbi:hypothetical protein QTP88_028606 [Uroleucon formosanum]